MRADVGKVADEEALARARSLVREATAVVALTGAGVSAESGVPTFRGAGGLWNQYRAEDLATPQAFLRDPRLVWEWYGWRRDLVMRCAPNAAHHALARASRDNENVRVITQNVDGLHAAAGGSPPIELHGSLFRMRCTGCGARRDDRDPIDASSRETLPQCQWCGSLMRPDIVWFGEPLDPDVLGEASRLASVADVCLVIGTSAIVYPAAGLAELTARAGGS
ncbi:MAG TPA: NAD-dependent deacylase, partial [Gemmatimonadaceae bacterium]|nr:NAD-dependent deacylase [Gemmatimonadaceae bacterium]